METKTDRKTRWLLVLALLLVLCLVRSCVREDHLTRGNQAMHTMHVYEQLVATGEYLLPQGDLTWFQYLNQYDAVMKLFYGPSNASISGVSEDLHNLIGSTIRHFQRIGTYSQEGTAVPQEELDRAMEYCQAGRRVCSAFKVYIDISSFMDHPKEVASLGQNIARSLGHGYFLDEDFQLLQQRLEGVIPEHLLYRPDEEQ